MRKNAAPNSNFTIHETYCGLYLPLTISILHNKRIRRSELTYARAALQPFAAITGIRVHASNVSERFQRKIDAFRRLDQSRRVIIWSARQSAHHFACPYGHFLQHGGQATHVVRAASCMHVVCGSFPICRVYTDVARHHRLTTSSSLGITSRQPETAEAAHS